MAIIISNLFGVAREPGKSEVHIVIHRPATVLTPEDARLLAAWLVLAAEDYDKFTELLEAIRAR